MKHNKIIYLTAFLLSLSLILLLEAGSLKLLAEDIKPIEKKEVEIELLLSASKQFVGEEIQSDGNSEAKIKSKKAVTQTQNENEEVDKNSSAVEEEIKEEKKQLVEKKIIEKKEPPKKEVKKVENKQKEEEQNQQQDNNELIEEKKIEKETLKKEKVEVENEPPAWMQDTKNKSEKDNTEEPKEDKKSNNFDLDSFIADIEAEEQAEENSQKTKEAAEASASQSDESSNSNKIDNKNQAENMDEKNEQNNEAINSAVEHNQNEQENKVYDLRKGSSDSIKKPGIKEYSKPSYPSNLRKRNIEGQVIVTLRIDKEGKILDLKINESSGYQSFDQAALKAVSKWEFKAAEKDNKKVEVIVNLPIKFKLD